MKTGILFLLLCIFNCSKQIEEKKIILDFFSAYLSESKSSDEIVDAFVGYKDEKGKRMAVAHMEAGRRISKSKKPVLTEITVVSGRERPDLQVDFVLAEFEKENIFHILLGNECVMSLIIQDKKVMSFFSIKKGNASFFLYY